MRSLFGPHSPLPALGITSLVLGVVAMVLAFMPVLGVSIGAFGLLCGILGFLAALFARTTSLRWSLLGMAVCVLALGTNFAIYYAPVGYLSDGKAPKLWQPAPDRPYVSPPASGQNL